MKNRHNNVTGRFRRGRRKSLYSAFPRTGWGTNTNDALKHKPLTIFEKENNFTREQTLSLVKYGYLLLTKERNKWFYAICPNYKDISPMDFYNDFCFRC